MEEEHEVLDWGNEDDEQNQAFYTDSAACGPDPRRGLGDMDDAEDSVSLGEEEDDQEYYAQQPQASCGVVAGSDSLPASPPRSTQSELTHQPPTPSLDGLQREDSAVSQNSGKQSIGSPHTRGDSASQQSPHRSQALSTITRLTHALPPKPVAISVPFLHPSHPSIVEATAMSTRPQGRSESNKSQVNGNTLPTVSRTGTGGKRSSSVGAVDRDSLPPGWEVRHPRSGDGVYFYNVETLQSTWTRPMSTSDSSHLFRESRGDHERRRRGSNVSAGDLSLSQLRSDRPQYQEHTRPRRGQPTSEISMADAPQPAPSLGGLSYEDRHYRPGEAENHNVSAVDRGRGDRGRDDNQDMRYNPRSDLSFTPPPSPGRGRSLSPSPPANVPRGRDLRPLRSMRRRGDNTDVDLSMQRDRDAPQVTPVLSRNHWSQAFNSPVGLDTHHQGSRRHHRPQIVDSFEVSAAPEDRSPLLRNGSGRVRNHDRDRFRIVETGERSQTHGQNTSAPRPRSLPPQRDSNSAHNAPRAQEYQSTPPIVIPSTTQDPPPPQTQRKRERPTRFGQPSTSTPPASLPPPMPASVQIAVTQVQSSFKQVIEDDPYVPDDILAESRPVVESVREKLISSISQQAMTVGVGTDASSNTHYPNEYMDLDRTRPPPPTVAHEIISLNPETQAPRRKRVPLPPQEDRFREISSRPRPTADRLGPIQGSSYPSVAYVQPPAQGLSEQRFPSSSSLNHTNLHPSQPPVRGEIDARRDVHTGGTIINLDKEVRQGHRHPITTGFPPPSMHVEIPMDLELDGVFSSSRLPPSPPSRHPMIEGFAQSSSAAFVGEAPRGPRAMSSANPGIHGPESITPVPPTSYPTSIHGGRNPERGRSPPPHPPSRGNDGGREVELPRQGGAGWSEDRHADGGHQRRREPRRYPGEFPRNVPGPTSGTNSIPVGARRPGGGSGIAPFGVAPEAAGFSISTPPGIIGNANMRPTRGTRGRGGGPLHNNTYERAPPPTRNDDRVESYRYGRSETGGPHQRGRDRNLAPFEKPSLSVNTTVMRESGPHSGGNVVNRYDAGPPPDSLKNQPRLWTPRGVSPPRELLRSNFSADSDGRAATLPPLSREPSSHVSPTWPLPPPDRGRQTPRYTDDALRPGGPGSSRDDTRKDQYAEELLQERFGIGLPPGGNNSLEGRLGDRYDFVEPERQRHELPPNPTLHREHGKPQSPQSRRKANVPFLERRPFRSEGNANAPEPPASRGEVGPHHHHALEDQTLSFPGAAERASRPPRPRRFGDSGHQGDHMAVDAEDPQTLQSQNHTQDHLPVYMHHRPENLRRGGSLLDRLSLDQDEGVRGDIHSPSLRDRVQVPSKRDREDMTHHGDNSFEDDDGSMDPAYRKVRRRSGKMRRPRRGGP